MRYLAFLSVLAILALPVLAEDRVISFDKEHSIVVVAHGDQRKTFRLTRFTEFTSNGAKVSLEKLTPGLKVTLSFSDPQTISRIAALPGQIFQPDGHTLRIKLMVDGGDVIRVRAGELTIEHVSWKKPSDILINGVPWQPNWDGDTTEAFKSFDPPLTPFVASKLTLKQISGRDKVTMDELAPGKFEKILTLHFDDPQGGSDVYEVEVTW